MKTRLAVGLVVCLALCQMKCLADIDSVAVSVAAVAATNRLATWEGRYYFTNMVEFASNSTERLFACIYVRDDVEYGKWNSGTLLDVYSATSNGVEMALPAETNIKGVTPVLQRIGVSTNYPFSTYWMLWRHLGNGGMLKYVEYAHTNRCITLVRCLQFAGEKENRRWTKEEYDDELEDFVYIPVTNFCWYANETIWENTNSVYRSCVGWP